MIADPSGELALLMAAHEESLDQVNPSPQPFHSSELELGNQTEDTSIPDKNPVNNFQPEERSLEEKMETGRVSWNVYSSFITAAYKGAFVPIILLSHVLFQMLQIESNYWMAWATEEEGRVSRGRMMGMFALISFGSSVFISARAVLLSAMTLKTAQQLFVGMITSIFHAPMSFFDITPSSRMLDRVIFFIILLFVVFVFCTGERADISLACLYVCITVFNRPECCGYGHIIQISWASICNYSAD